MKERGLNYAFCMMFEQNTLDIHTYRRNHPTHRCCSHAMLKSTAIKHQVVIPMFEEATHKIAQKFLPEWLDRTVSCIFYFLSIQEFQQSLILIEGCKGLNLPGGCRRFAGTRREPANGGGEVAHLTK